MKNAKIKLAILGVFGALSTQALATGLVALPTAGFAVGANTSAYTPCNPTGNFGSNASTAPTTGANNTCAVFPTNATVSPVSTVATAIPAGSTNLLNTNANGVLLLQLNQKTWRNAGNTECVFGKQVKMASTSTYDYNPSRAGNNPMEVNDIALGGFSATPTVNAGYYYLSGSSSVLYRVGRAFTSVQTHSNGAGGLGTGYLAQPLVPATALGAVEINGVGQVLTPPGPTPTAAQQTADIRTNWVDFTLDVTGGPDEDGVDEGGGSSTPFSPWLYVQGSCNGTVTNLANSIILRQTGQETQPWVTVKISGFTNNTANASF